jgi:aminoglycoside 3-N-acetyltransferase I
MNSVSWDVRRLAAEDVSLMHALNGMFGQAFNEPDTYDAKPPSDNYVQRLLSKEDFIALAVVAEDHVVGGLVAYELEKFEQARREVYIYDLAVAQTHRRRGIAKSLIQRLREIASARGAWVIFVQADHGDEPAIALYEKLGVREEVLHFDIAVPARDSGARRRA